MFSVEIDYLVRKEQYKDQQRDVTRQRLIQLARPQQGSNIVLLRRMVSWVGALMVKFGSKLQHQYQHQTLPQ